jgi:Raf kinase inhibitor-like YbhB/YbcL family protein
MSLTLSSPAFADGGTIPRKYTCDGNDTSPPLEWEGVPDRARSLALIVDDPDAPKHTFAHWVVYNIPPDANGLSEGATSLPRGTQVGTNDFERRGYGGPCPSKGRHRYVFKLFALDAPLDQLDAPTKGDLEAAMKGHVIDQAQAIATYERAD